MESGTQKIVDRIKILIESCDAESRNTKSRVTESHNIESRTTESQYYCTH